MSNVATVSFKLSPDHYTVLKALADSKGQTVSAFVRDTVTDVHALHARAAELASFFSAANRNPDSGQVQSDSPTPAPAKERE